MSKFPQIKYAFKNWQQNITLVKITQSIINYKNVEEEQVLSFKGVIQPLQAEQLKIKPEGQRDWQWLMIHTNKEIALNVNDRIKYKNQEFKVMAKKNYSLNDYFYYEVVEAYE